MKKFMLMALVMIFLMLFAASCTKRYEEDIIVDLNRLRLNQINEMAGEQYESIDDAFWLIIDKYEENKSFDDLVVICYITNLEEYMNYASKYYGEFFKRVLEGEETPEELGASWTHGKYYISRLREEGKYKEYREFYENLNKYLPESDMFGVLLWYRRDISALSDNEIVYHINVLHDYEEKYKNVSHLMYIAGLYRTISDLYYYIQEDDSGDYYDVLCNDITEILHKQISDD